MKITLYKMDATGTVRQWSCEKHGTTIVSHWGQMRKTTRGWEEPQALNSTQEECENDEKACARLVSIVKKKRFREGYTSAIPKAVPFLPMLAQTYEGQKFKSFSLQPKLDGFRCIASSVELRSRQNTLIRSLPHISEALQTLPEGVHLDGELYIHGVDLQTLSGYIKRDSVHKLGHLIEYHVYDMILLDIPFIERYNHLHDLMVEFYENYEGDYLLDRMKNSPVKLVETFPIGLGFKENEQEFLDNQENQFKVHHDHFVRRGFEGLIIRNNDGMYELDKRSPDLLKYKSFIDDEFLIVEVQEAKNRCATFTCKTEQGEFFDCTPKFTTARKQQILTYKQNYIGKYLQVRFPKLTNRGVPFQPIGINIFDKKSDKHGPS